MPHLRDNDASPTREHARHTLQQLNRALDAPNATHGIDVAVEGTHETLRLSRDVAELLRDILTTTAAGQTVGVIPMQAELTTQQAADLLNVSRPYVVKLMDQGVLPGHKVGTHRRLYASAVHEFKHRRNIEQRAAADELTALSEELGLYE